jgi:hypothetical protein
LIDSVKNIYTDSVYDILFIDSKINFEPNFQASFTRMRSAAGRNSTWCVTNSIVFSLRIPIRHSCRKHLEQNIKK